MCRERRLTHRFDEMVAMVETIEITLMCATLSFEKPWVRLWQDCVRRYMDGVMQFVAAHLKLTIPSSKTSLVQLPMPVDVLGVCTNGVRTWIRPATERKAIDRLEAKYVGLASTLLDSACSYYGISVYSGYGFI